MLISLIKNQLTKNRDLILREGQLMNGFMQLLMKHSYSGTTWTKEEKKQLKTCLKHMSYYVPVLIIFLLPFGSLILPILVEVLDNKEDKSINSADNFPKALDESHKKTETPRDSND